MNNSGNRSISIRLVYVILVIGIIIAAIVAIAKNQSSNSTTEIIAANTEVELEDKNRNELSVASTTTSRSSSEVRSEVGKNKEEKKVEETKKDNKKETKTSTKPSTTKKEPVKSETLTKKSSSKAETSTKSETKTEEKSSTKKSTTKKENKKSTTTSIKDVKISRSMDLTKRTGLSRSDFIKLMSKVRADTSGFFEDNAGKIYDLCEKYSINEIFFCGLISAESGWNIASNHRRTHNYISMMSRGKLIHYDSVSEGLEAAARLLHKNYLTPGGAFYHGKTLAGVKTCFCPSATWVNLVYGRMCQIV